MGSSTTGADTVLRITNIDVTGIMSSSVEISPLTSGSASNVDLVDLQNGRLAAVYSYVDGGTSGLYYSVFDSAGNVVSTHTQIPNAAGALNTHLVPNATFDASSSKLLVTWDTIGVGDSSNTPNLWGTNGLINVVGISL